MNERYRVPRPSKVRRVHMPQPPLEPLRGMPEWPGPRLDSEPELFEAEPAQDFGDLLALAEEIARADARVGEHLAGRRHAWLGASRLDAAKGKRGASVVVVIYDYERNVAVEVSLGGEGERLEVTGVEEVGYHPAPSDEEVERAIELARGDRRVAGHLSEDLEATAILVSDVEQGDRHHGHRRIDVGFGRPDERLPSVRALVDLGAERVLGVHAEHGHRYEREEEGS
jgi:hypothetical protein